MLAILPALQFVILGGTISNGVDVSGHWALTSGAFSVGWHATNPSVWQQGIAGTIMIALDIGLLQPAAVSVSHRRTTRWNN